MNKFFIIIFILISSVSFGETINSLDIHYSDGLFYKKGVEKPFTGIVEGNSVGRLVNGKREGTWEFFDDGNVVGRVNFKNDSNLRP